jgi:hypothetical protein
MFYNHMCVYVCVCVNQIDFFAIQGRNIKKGDYKWCERF